MTQTALSLPGQPTLDEALDALVRRHRAAGGLGIQLLNLVGGQAEGLLDRLPTSVKAGLDQATETALRGALGAAGRSRGVLRDQKSWINTALATAMGAAGGIGGLGTALAELPVTVTMLLRAIQGIAAEYGFDPDDPAVQAECLTVLSAAGPLEADDGADMGFLSARITLTGSTVSALISRVAPRLGVALGQKLAAQTVPVLGAAAGAATNFIYTGYYQEMAHIRFGLLWLAREHDMPLDALLEQMRLRLAAPRQQLRP